jgi:hypothetical protein
VSGLPEPGPKEALLGSLLLGECVLGLGADPLQVIVGRSNPQAQRLGVSEPGGRRALESNTSQRLGVSEPQEP